MLHRSSSYTTCVLLLQLAFLREPTITNAFLQLQQSFWRDSHVLWSPTSQQRDSCLTRPTIVRGCHCWSASTTKRHTRRTLPVQFDPHNEGEDMKEDGRNDHGYDSIEDDLNPITDSVEWDDEMWDDPNVYEIRLSAVPPFSTNQSLHDEMWDDPNVYAVPPFSTNQSLPLILDDGAAPTAALLSSNLSYFYLKNELGLSEEAMWRITYEAGSALGMTAQTLRRKVQVLRENLNLNDDDIRKILEGHPPILHLSADKNLAPTILFLVRALDLGKDDLRTIVVGMPSVLNYKRDTLKSKIQFFTKLMGYSTDECRKLLVTTPHLLRPSVPRLVATMRFLVRDMEIPLVQLRKIVQRNPRILLYSLDNNLIPKIIYFGIMTLQLNLQQIQKLLVSYPLWLDYNLDRHILPIATYLLNDLEFSPNEVGAMLLKFPRLMTYSLRKIKYQVGYLRFEQNLDASQVKRVLYQAPQVLGLNHTTLVDKVRFLGDALQLNDQQLQVVIAGMPTLVLLNPTTNLQPKLNLLLQSFGGNRELVRDAVLRLPTLLGYSLEKRLRPRMEQILQAGLDPSSITVGIPQPESSFQTWLDNSKRKLKRTRRLSIVPVFSSNVATSLHGRHDIEAMPDAEDGEDNALPGNERIVHWTRERRPLRGR